MIKVLHRSSKSELSKNWTIVTGELSVDYEAEESVNRRSDDYVNHAGWKDFLSNLDKIETQAQKTKFYLSFLNGATDKKPWKND